MDIEKLKAEFANKGGTVKKIPDNARAFDERQIFDAIRGNVSKGELAESRAMDAIDTANEARLNGHSITGFDSQGNIYVSNGRKY